SFGRAPSRSWSRGSLSGAQAPVALGALAQASCELGGEGVGGKAPRPVALRPPRRVHAGGRIETEKVLERHDAEAGHRHLDGADEIPVDLPAVGAEIAEAMLTLPSLGLAGPGSRALREPAHHRVAVGRSRVGEMGRAACGEEGE